MPLFQVTVQRYLLVRKPHVSKELVSASTVKKWMISVVISTILYSLPFYFRYEVFFLKRAGQYIPEKAKWSDNDVYDIFYDLISYFLVLAVVPLCILAFTTIQLMRALKASRKKTNLSQSQNFKEDITLSLVIVVIIYAMCKISNLAGHIWSLLDCERFCGTPYYAFTIFSFLVIHINSAANFVIFFLIGERFRKKFLDKIRKIFNCNKVGPVIPAIERLSKISVPNK